MNQPAQWATPVTDACAEPAQVKLRIEGLGKQYGAITALHQLSLQVHSGELLTLLGASGSGKTTLLQVIAGLVAPSQGQLWIDGDDRTHAPAHARDIGVVFQNYALFPHLTVAQNVAFALQMRGVARAEQARRVDAALEMVGLGPMGERFPRELSGGQQQRVALARCFVYQPSLVLMDEPLSALDRKLREQMQVEIRRLHRETGSTIIFVTHDQEEALALSDRICLMHNGRIEQVGSPRSMYERPRTLAVARFIGESNLLEGRVSHAGYLQAAEGQFRLPAGCEAALGQAGALLVRPEHLEVVEPGRAAVQGQLIEALYAGAETRLSIRLASGNTLTARRASNLPALPLGSTLGLSWLPAHSHFVTA